LTKQAMHQATMFKMGIKGKAPNVDSRGSKFLLHIQKLPESNLDSVTNCNDSFNIVFSPFFQANI
jgi:hypothetical protein